MLTKEFLAPYYARGDNFPNLLARCTYRSKYSRNGGTEVWTDTIRRVVEANCALDPTTTVRECELLFHVFWTMQALPPGRGLWVGGIDSIPADARYNCFSKETKFFANRRLVSFEDVLGETVQVRCVDGEWRPAEVKSFGVQRLFRFVLKAPGRSNFKLEYTATENHRWITDNRGMVTDLKVGDTVRVIPDKIDENSKAFKDGFIHGIVFGDGSALGEGVYQTRLCGDKAKHLDAMREYGGFISSSNPPSYNGDPIVRVCCSTTDLKGLPLESATFEYQAGFLAGWLATDGSFRKDGRGGNRLSSINHEALNWVIERAPFLGYCVTGDLIDLSEETNFGKRSGLVRVLTLTTESVLYTVSQKIDEGREEEVFCVTEPETHTFTIEGGIRTGQCWYTTVYDIDDWGWVANQLMLGGGVGVGLEKIHNLPTVAKNDSLLHITCRPDHPNITEVAPDPFLIPHSRLVVADSREGWVGGLITALHGAFTGTNTFFDVSPVRERGAPIKTFGGTACGPGPLVDLLRSVWNVVRGAAGRKLTSVEALDITNYIGRCIKAGNVRRSALIALGGMDDQPFRDAKKDWEKVASHRHTSNNSINFHQFDQFTNFDWVGLVNDNIEFGEPGLNNLALGRMYDPELEGINPCQPAWATLLTPVGIKTMGAINEGDTVWSGRRWTTVCRKVCTGTKMVYRYRTTAGSFIGTSNHRVVSNGQKIEAGEAESIDTCVGEYQRGYADFDPESVMDGLVLGDGMTHKATKYTLLLIGDEDQDYFQSEVSELIKESASNIKQKAWHVVHSYDSLPKTYERKIPGRYVAGSAKQVRSFLRGLYSANGSVVGGYRVTLKAASRDVIDAAQIMLSSLGISSYVTTNKEHDVEFSNGTYTCRESYDLNISSDRVRFKNLIGFIQKDKCKMLEEICERPCNKPKTSYEIIDVEELGEETVYDITVTDTEHTYWTGGLLVSNCGEQQLHNRESCNLAEIFPALFDGSVPTEQIFKLVTRYTLRQRLTPLTDPLAEEQRRKNMRIGVGLGGICDFDWTEEQLHDWYRIVCDEANSYADELGVARPITKTTVKPSGTISLLNGSDPGLHAPEAPFYVRRMRISLQEPMAQALAEANVPFEPDIYDNTGNTMVFSFPMRARNQKISALTQTLEEQFERQLAVQKAWADNAVSCTIKFDKDEAGDMARMLSHYAPQLKSVSMLPKAHGYKQAPYEPITEDEYVRLAASIDHTATLAPGDMEIEECAGGACPIR